jgi:hydroxymethylbilane synthase
MKDMPTEVPGGLTIAAIPEREDPRDAIVGIPLAELRDGASVGTSSLRRSAQLRALRPDLVVESIRGNVDTRLRKLEDLQFDAIVLAAAGLRRLSLEGRIAEVLEPEVMCPAVGQGALAVETRDDGGIAHQICRRLDHAETRAAVTAERALLATLGGGCQVPIGAYARIAEGALHVDAVVVSPEGDAIVRRGSSGPPSNAESIGRALGEELLAMGGREILEDVYGGAAHG